MMRLAKLRRTRGLLREQRGIAATEFALVAPVFILMVMGLFDVSHQAYARALFDGAVEKAAREASLETGNTDDADEMVERIVSPILPGVELETARTSYFDFADIDRPEQYEDDNGNDVCDNNEAYVDENESEAWEADIGQGGNGGANDVVVYTVTATYEPLFKVPFMPDQWLDRSMTASAVKKNQPFADQDARDSGAVTRTCIDPV